VAGDGGPLGDAERSVYRAAMERNARALDQLLRPGDIALLHDPQTAGLAGPLQQSGVRVVWRRHVGVDVPNDEAREAWRFLLPFVQEAEVNVFSRASFGWDDLDQDRIVVNPALDRRLRAEEPGPRPLNGARHPALRRDRGGGVPAGSRLPMPGRHARPSGQAGGHGWLAAARRL
jgi:hypothetical protein